MTRSRLQLVAVLCLMLLVAAACGQKPGVALRPEGVSVAAGGTGGTLQLPEGTALDEEGNLVDTKTGEVIATAEELEKQNPGFAASQNTNNGGPTDGGGDQGPGPGPDQPGDTPPGEEPPPGQKPPGDDDGPGAGGNVTGVSDDVIKIGIHAPITGAAPVPTQSFEKGKDLYFKFLESQGKKINGRRVEVAFRNDNYNPSQAVTACRELVEDEGVFLLVGVAGADQLQACAQYAHSVGVPYISGGVTEIGVNQIPGYFAAWMSYPQQGPLLADYLVTKAGAGDEKNGMLRFNTPAFSDANSSWINAMRERGATVDYNRAISKTAGQSDAQSVATELQAKGIQNVYVLTSPTFFIQLANAAQSQGYRPHWVGVGLSMALDTVASIACRNGRSIDGAHFLNPTPSFFDSNRFDPSFRKAGGTDDIQFGLWGISKLLAQMLAKPGRDLSRERFVFAVERSKFSTGIGPPVAYSPDNHFGGQSMHLNRADCSKNAWVTEQAFVSDFK